MQILRISSRPLGVTLIHSWSTGTIFTLPATPDLFELTQFDNDQVTLGFTSAYVRPMEDGGRLRAGYELNQQRPDQEVTLSRGPSEGEVQNLPG